MRRLLILFFFAIQINQVFATETPVKGVWRGKVGNAEVVVCFNGDKAGSYYYSRYKTPIQLSLSEKDKTWAEAGKTGVWKLDAPMDGKLNGLWNDLKSQHVLAVALISPSNQNDAKPCASNEYNDALEGFPVLQVGKIEQFEGKQFRKLRIADVESIELLTSDGAVKKVNQKLRAILPKSKDDLIEYFEKRREFLGNMGLAAEDETFAQPHYWSAHWITVHYYRWAAGFGARGISLVYRTWNMKTGEEVDLWQWFGTKSSGYDDTAPLPSRVKTFLFKNLKVEPECIDSYYGEGEYHATLEPTGIRFWEHAFGTGCEKEFLIPYAKLGPILSAKGKVAIKSLIK